MSKVITDKVIPTMSIDGSKLHYMDWSHIFPIGRNSANYTLAASEWHVLQHDTEFNGYRYRRGSMFKFWDGPDYSVVYFHASSRTPEGNTPGEFYHRM